MCGVCGVCGVCAESGGVLLIASHLYWNWTKVEQTPGKVDAINRLFASLRANGTHVQRNKLELMRDSSKGHPKGRESSKGHANNCCVR